MKPSRPQPKLRLGIFALGVTASALTGCADGNSQEEIISTTKQRLEIAESEAFTFSFSILSHTPIGEVGVSGTQSLKLADRVELEGDAVSTLGQLDVGNEAKVRSLVADGNIKIGHRANVDGDVTTHGVLNAESSALINGSILQGSSIGSTQALEWEVPSMVDFGEDVRLEPDQSRTLPQGAYGELAVKSRSVLKLTTGTYVFSKISIESQGKLLIDSSNGPVQIYVRDNMMFRGTIQSTSSRSADLFIGIMGSGTSFIESSFRGVVVAPNSALRVQAARPHGHVAAFHAKDLSLEADTKVGRLDFDWSEIVDDGVVLDPLPTAPPHVMAESPGEVSVIGEGWRDGIPTGSKTWSTASPLEFELADEFEVEGGVIGNGTVTFTFTGSSGSQSCLFQGQSSSNRPITKLEFSLGRLLKFVSCTDGLPADARRTASSFGISVEGVADYPVTVGSPIVRDSYCSEKLPLLTAAQTAQMREAFSWSDATKVPEYNEDGTPTLYYSWVYVRNEEELTAYRKLLIHQLNRPLFQNELDELAGRCGVITNPGDGEGVFIPSVIPGVTYNRLITALTSDEVEGDRVIFDAVILRDVPQEVQAAGGSISYRALAESGFHYLHYQSTNPLDVDGGLALDGGVAKALVAALQWVGEAVRNVGELILEGLGEFDELFRGDVDVQLWAHEINSDTQFDLSGNVPMIRAWGSHRGRPLGADDTQITVMQKLFGSFLPSESKGWTNMDGKTEIDVVPGETQGTGMCVELKSEGALVTDFLIAQELCDFRGFDANIASQATDFRLGRIDDARTEVPVRIDNERLAGLYQSDDLHQWSDNVADFSTKRARILSGYWADTFSSGDADAGTKRLFAPCLNYGNTLSDTMLAASTTSGLVASALVGIPGFELVMLTFAAVIGNTDIVMSENSKIRTQRNVMSHEYGHYLFCSLLQENNSQAVSYVIWSTIAAGDDQRPEIRALNEAMADYFTGQVAGSADYPWLFRTYGEDYCSDNGKACFDQNLSSSATTADGPETIGRFATMVHDLFDGRNAGFTAHVPGNADLWDGTTGSRTLASSQYGSFDSNLERLELGGHHLLTFAKHIADELVDFPVPNGISNEDVYSATNSTMEELNVNWCDRCRLLALHVPGDKANVQDLWETCGSNSMLADVLGPAPVDDLRMSAANDSALGVESCQACPDGYFSDENGQCTYCPNTVSGNSCEICEADVVIDATTASSSIDFPTDSTVPGDNCPDVFWLEVQNLDALTDIGFVSAGANLKPVPFTELSCERETELTTSWLGASGTTNTQKSVGVWSRDCGLPGDDICLVECDLPGDGFLSQEVQADSVRYGTLRDAGRVLNFGVTRQIIIPH